MLTRIVTAVSTVLALALFVGGLTVPDAPVWWMLNVGIVIVGVFGVRGVRWFLNRLKKREYEVLADLLYARRFLDVVERAAWSRARFILSSEAALVCGIAEVQLWRLAAARVTFRRCYAEVIDAHAEYEILAWELLAAELAGDVTVARERVEQARVPSRLLVLAHAVRAAREGDWARVKTLLAGSPRGAESFEPLRLVLLAWANEGERAQPIDKIQFLGETGLEQVERAWPELAAFVRRAPAGVSEVSEETPQVATRQGGR